MPSRRQFLAQSGALAGAMSLRHSEIRAGTPGQAETPAQTGSPATHRIRPGGHDSGYDPWLEVDANAFRHNVREVSRLAGGRPILAVVKNNGYGLGDTLVGPLLASCAEVGGIACVRPAEALAMRRAGVRKPILTMSEVGDEEAAELAAHDVTLSCWLDDSGDRLDRVARRVRKPVAVHPFVDTGMNREGMPFTRALAWIADLAARKSVRITGTYHMFVHELDFDREQHARFMAFTQAAAARNVKLGTLHAAPSFELFYLPESHLDMVRVGNALFGNYPGPDVRDRADLKPVFRLKSRVTRVELVPPGESAGFRRAFMPEVPTWVALLPVGHTDGYPASAGGTCQVLINGALYPVVQGGVASAHTLVAVGEEKRVNVGDTAILIGADDPAIEPHAVAQNTKVGFYPLITKFSAMLPRRLA